MSTVSIEVVVSPALTAVPPFDPYLRQGVASGLERVHTAGEGNIASRTRAGGGRQWAARRGGRGGYGPLAGSLTTHLKSEPGDYAVGYVKTITFYARFLESGAKRHVIRGRQHVLRFGPAEAPVFRRTATHPGIRARWFMRDAGEGSRDAVVADFEAQTRQWAAAVGGTA